MRRLPPALATTRVLTACDGDPQAPTDGHAVAGAAFMLERTRLVGHFTCAFL